MVSEPSCTCTAASYGGLCFPTSLYSDIITVTYEIPNIVSTVNGTLIFFFCLPRVDFKLLFAGWSNTQLHGRSLVGGLWNVHWI